jgi:hypothetical protein
LGRRRILTWALALGLSLIATTVLLRSPTFNDHILFIDDLIYRWRLLADGPQVIDALNTMSERDRFLRGMHAWVGYKQTGVPYVRPERMFGVTTNNLLKNIAWARKGIFSFSFVPLELISYPALGVTGLAVLGIFYILAYFIRPVAPSGFMTLTCPLSSFPRVNRCADHTPTAAKLVTLTARGLAIAGTRRASRRASRGGTGSRCVPRLRSRCEGRPGFHRFGTESCR